MRIVRVLLLTAVCLSPALAQDDKPMPRHGVNPDLETYPQATPKETLASVLKAINAKRMDYLLAQLADPDFVDQSVKTADGKFDDLVQEATAKLSADPTAVKELLRFLKEGEWEASDTAAAAQLKDIKDRRVFMRKIDNRWFLQNQQKPSAEK